VAFTIVFVSCFRSAYIGMPLVGCRLRSGLYTYDERAIAGSDISARWISLSAKLNLIAMFDRL